MFSGTDYEERYRSYQELDEEGDEIFLKSIDKLSTVATIWYMSGTQEQDEFDAVLSQINTEADVNDAQLASVVADKANNIKDEPDDEPEGESEEEPKKAAAKEKQAPKKATPKKRGRPKKTAVDEG